MTDKERILMAIITRVIPKLAYNCFNNEDRRDVIESSFLNGNVFEKGDLVIASTTINIHDFIVGFVEESKRDCVVIREIGSKRLCRYYNECFYKINKKYLGFECLEGVEYKTYQKVLKAFDKYTGYSTRFKSIKFDNGKCFVESRMTFSNDTKFEINFDYKLNTSIKTIGLLLKQSEIDMED